MYFERYLEFSNFMWPRQTVSSEFCIAEKTVSLEHIRRQCQQDLLQHFHGLLKCKDTISQGYFWALSIAWGCDMLF